ncbi:hypothetical protein ABZ667_33125 [Streptomyces lavendulae]|uniref:hypothetical protein n=1 Tax=Streptomyces lavendulae TaxID=1914 RepID=UPI0033FD66E9
MTVPALADGNELPRRPKAGTGAKAVRAGFGPHTVAVTDTILARTDTVELDNGTMCQARLAEEVRDYERYAGHRVFGEGARSVCGHPEEGLAITVDVRCYGLVTYDADTDEDALGRRAAKDRPAKEQPAKDRPAKDRAAGAVAAEGCAAQESEPLSTPTP